MTTKEALTKAIKESNTEAVAQLLAQSSEVFHYHGSLLRAAVVNRKWDIAKLLIEHGADVNVGAQSGRTILMLASLSNQAEIVKRLLELGVDVDAREKEWGWTALMFASGAGSFDVVKLLVGYGADIHIQDDEDLTALDLVRHSYQYVSEDNADEGKQNGIKALEYLEMRYAQDTLENIISKRSQDIIENNVIEF